MNNLSIAIDSLERVLEDENSESKDDPLRKELLWEQREEIFLQKIVEDCKKQSKLHRRKGKKFKKLYTGFGIPSTLLPIILSGLTEQLNMYPLVHSLVMITSGILTGVSTFMNFGRKYEEHFNYEAKYGGLAGDISTELCKPKSFRVACDVYLERVRLLYGNLNSNAPLVDDPTIEPKKKRIR